MKNLILPIAFFAGVSFSIFSSEPTEHQPITTSNSSGVCEGYGPQTPRDIDQKEGLNKRRFTLAPSAHVMNLCNIHFHNNAEHKAKAFSLYAGDGEHGHGGGYQCQLSQSLNANELRAVSEDVCHGLKPGDTIEVHWVHSSCAVNPGEGLGACSSAQCANPELRVEAQVYTLVNDSNALQFQHVDYKGTWDGFNQANLPTGTGQPVVFAGSTTGPKYSQQQCSPLQVTWSVRPNCAKLDINSLAKWCKKNLFNENHAHGVRKLVTNPSLLSEIK